MFLKLRSKYPAVVDADKGAICWIQLLSRCYFKFIEWNQGERYEIIAATKPDKLKP